MLYQNLTTQDEKFKLFLAQCEANVNQQIMSLIIKPVQRLPRYVLLTKEIQHRLRKLQIIHQEIRTNEDQQDQIFGLNQTTGIKLKRGMCHGRYEKICFLENWSQNILNMMADCAQECNNNVRQHQDNLRMHQLQDMFKESGLELNIVSKDRLLLKEGELIRHHRGSSESHLIQLFSDVLITSSRTLRGLKPQRTFKLSKDSNIICLLVPPKDQSHSEMNTWFVLVDDEKSIYFEAKSYNETLEWVGLINTQLKQNQAIRDIYNIKSQINLVNTILTEIRRRNPSSKKIVNQSKDSSILPKRFDESFLQQSHYIQTGWWYLLNVLEELTSKEGDHITTRYKRLIDKQCKEVASQLMLTIVVKKNESNNLIQSLLFNNSLHYLIAIGTVFEYQGPCSVTNMEIVYDRPLLMKLFLLSDVLIGTYIESANEHVVYSFHIFIQDLEFSDKLPNGSQSNAIILMDKSKPTKRRLSLSLLPFSNSECVKRVFYTSSLEEKFEWLSLFYLAKIRFEDERLGFVPIIGTIKDNTCPQTYLNKLKTGSFENLATNCNQIGWKYEC